MKLPVVLLLGAALLVAACHSDQNPSAANKTATAGKATTAAKPAATAAEQTESMVEAASTGDATLPVKIKFDLPQRPAVGVPFPLEVALITQVAADSATLKVEEPSGYTVSAGADDLVIPKLAPDGVYRRRLTVVPAAEGVFFVTLSVTTKVDDVVASRSFNIPFIVAPPRPAAASAAH